MMNKYRTSLAKGFTIVELAIVISVIGIIASITVVTYNGSQVKARNAKTAAAAQQYKEGLENYLTLKKQYPPVDANSWYCLNIPVANCVIPANAPPWIRSATLEAELAKVMDTPLPLPSFGPGTNTSWDTQLGYIPYKGGTSAPTLDGQNAPFLLYILEGTTTCPAGPVASGAWPAFFSAAPAAGRTYIASGLNMTVCWVPLSKP